VFAVTIRQDLHDEIDAERDRQDAKFGWIGAPKSILPGDNEYAKLGVLMEEVGEVSRELLESQFAGVIGTTPHLEEELIQVAAVAVAWVEAIREKRHVRERTYIIAATYQQARLVARSLGEKPHAWHYVTDGHALQGVGCDAKIVFYETWNQRKDAAHIAGAVDMAVARGAAVRQICESDLR
jgi:NTP pyrophosphatase (non-canonical NTP hydrolase)